MKIVATTLLFRHILLKELNGQKRKSSKRLVNCTRKK